MVHTFIVLDVKSSIVRVKQMFLYYRQSTNKYKSIKCNEQLANIFAIVASTTTSVKNKWKPWNGTTQTSAIDSLIVEEMRNSNAKHYCTANSCFSKFFKKIKIKTTVKFRLLSHKTINEMINSKKIEYLKNRYPSNE